MSQKTLSTAHACRIYSLDEAATFLDSDTSTILQHGAQGAISLFACIPDGVVVCSTTESLLRFHDPSYDQYEKSILRSQVSGKRPTVLTSVEYLRLSRSDCSAIQKRGECSQAVYTAALHANAAQELVSMELPPPMDSSVFGLHPDFLFTRRIACYAAGTDFVQNPGALKKIRLTESSLRIFGEGINVLQALGDIRSETTSSTIPFEDGFVEQEYMSKRLIVLHRAAVRFWNPNHKPPAKPTINNIAEWIQQEYLKETGSDFGKDLANKTVQLIRRSYEDWSQTRFDGLAAQGKLTWFQAIVEVGEVWEKIDVTQRDTVSKGLKQELVDVFRLPTYLAECVVTLLRPEGVVAAGRPKEK